MFQKKIHELFSSMQSKMFWVADEILITGFAEQRKTTMHHKPGRQVNLKLTKIRGFSDTPGFGQGVTLNPREVQALTDILSMNSKKELQ